MFMSNEFQNESVLEAWDDVEAKKVNEEIPEQLKEFFLEHDVDGQFKCTVQQFTTENYASRPRLIGEWTDSVPNYEKIVLTSGSGWYRYKFSFKQNGLNKTQNVDIDLTADNWKWLAKQGKRVKRKQEQEEMRDEMSEQATMNMYGQVKAPEGNSIKDVLEMITPILALGQNQNQNSGMDMKMMLMFMTMMNSNNQNGNNMMMQMMKMNSDQMQNLLPLLVNNNGNQSMEGMLTMMDKMADLKAKLSPKEEGLIEKVGNFIGEHFDTVMALVNKTPEQREQDTGYQKVEKDWRTKKIRKKMQTSPEFAKGLIDHLDKKLQDPSVTDEVLEGFLKYKRHDAEPKQAEQPEEVEAETVDKNKITPDDFEDE